MLLAFLLLVLGFLLLIKGADWLVNGASALAKKMKVSDLAIGLTVVAFGTSAPELVVNAFSASRNLPDIVFGNIIGSNNFNLFIILGLAGMIAPLSVQSSTVRWEIPLSFIAIIFLYLLSNFLFTEQFILGRLEGIIFLLMFCVFLYYVYSQLRSDPIIQNEHIKPYSTFKIWRLILPGLAFLAFGGKLVVDNAIEIAQTMGVSQKIIGLTIIAAGTSMPELATSVVAAIRKNNDIAVGNIIGSNIFNIFLIMGVSAVIRPLIYNPKFNIDLAILAAGTILLFLFMFLGKKHKLDRWEALLMILIYTCYTCFLVFHELN
jgi:cation:H+ antiporter